ncbi:MAG: chalcone isomerase family protein [Burkholderiaceae bacterium]
MSTVRERLMHEIAAVLAGQPRLPMEQLAQAVGTSRATLHRMFPTREAIVSEILARAVEECQAAIEAAAIDEGPVEPALRRLIDGFMANTEFFLFLRSAGNEHFESSDAILEAFEPHQQRVIALFRRGQEAGSLRVDLSAQWMHDAMAGLLYEAACAMRAGRLAAADAPDFVVSLLLDGTRRRTQREAAARADPARAASGPARALLAAILASVGLALSAPDPVQAAEIEGVEFADRVELGGQSLSVNGLGLREVYIVKTWVAALYTPMPMRSAQAVIGDPGPRRLAISLLADVSIDHVARGILDAVRRNHDPLLLVSIEPAIEAFVAALRAIGPTQKGDRLVLDLVDDQTRLSFNGLTVGEPVTGLLFRDALLRAFLGKAPVDAELGRQLLGLAPPDDGARR